MSETLFGDGPEAMKLRARLHHAYHVHFDWGPKAHLLTPEERAKVVNDALDDVGARSPEAPRSHRLPMDVREFVKTLPLSHA